MRQFDYNLFADYHQFYLQDETAEGDLSESWTEEAVERLLAVAPGAVGIGTVRNMEVPVTVEVLDSEAEQDFELWDHVTECSLEVRSGRIVIAGCTDYFPEAARIEVAPATYRVRVSYGSLDTLSQDGLEGNDRYRVQLWKGPPAQPSVLKNRTG